MALQQPMVQKTANGHLRESNRNFYLELLHVGLCRYQHATVPHVCPIGEYLQNIVVENYFPIRLMCVSNEHSHRDFHEKFYVQV